VFISFSKILGISILPKEKKRREGKKSKIKGEIDKGNNKAVSAFSFPSYYTTPSSKSSSFLSVAICILFLLFYDMRNFKEGCDWWPDGKRQRERERDNHTI